MNAEAAPSIESNREEKPAHRAPRCEAQCEFHPCGRTQLQAGRPLPDHAFPTGGGRCGGTLLWGGGPHAWRRVWGCPPQLLVHLQLLCLLQEAGGDGLPAPEAAGLSRGCWLMKAQLWPAGQRLSLSAKQVRRSEGGRVDRLLN